MLNNDATILKIKHEVLYLVAKHAFEGTLEEKRDELPFEMIPGPQAMFRCCIYREREIIRQRIRLAEGKPAGSAEDDNLVQIINSACEGCPISRFVVTDNCQKCMSRACQQACRFGAISMGRDKSYIDPAKCKECGQCAKACPYNAIADLTRPCKRSCPVNAISVEDNGTGIARIDKSKCIQCGQCIHKCPFGAIGSKTFIVDIIKAMQDGKEVYAMVAPAAEGQFGPDITIESWRKALKRIGFADVAEVAVGADLTAVAEAKEWAEAYKDGEKKSTSCCPAFKKLIENHFPELKDIVSDTVSPMCAASRLIKATHPGAVTVFIGPCIAKKQETLMGVSGNADYALTFGEIRAMFKAKDVTLEPAEDTHQASSVFGRKFAGSGGVSAAVIQALKESGEDEIAEAIDVCNCNGVEECKKALLLMKAGRLPQQFIEGMICEGGCVNGPSSHRGELASRKDRSSLQAKADKDGILTHIEREQSGKIDMSGNKCKN